MRNVEVKKAGGGWGRGGLGGWDERMQTGVNRPDTPQPCCAAQRAAFATAQQRMLDIIRERDTLLESMPSMWFIRNKEKIEYDVISSDVTESVLGTSRENDIELFS